MVRRPFRGLTEEVIRAPFLVEGAAAEPEDDNGSPHRPILLAPHRQQHRGGTTFIVLQDDELCYLYTGLECKEAEHQEWPHIPVALISASLAEWPARINW